MLTETKEPGDNYQKLKDPITVKVALNGKNLEVTASGVYEITGSYPSGYTIKVANYPKTVSIKVVKVEQGNEDKTLSGAEFELYNGPELVKSGTTDSNGVIEWKDLQVDTTYTLKETAAPAGYLMPSGTTKILIMNDGTVKLNGEALSQKVVDGIAEITVTNNPGVPLPSTGGPGAYLYTITGGGVMLLAGAVLLARRKRERA